VDAETNLRAAPRDGVADATALWRDAIASSTPRRYAIGVVAGGIAAILVQLGVHSRPAPFLPFFVPWLAVIPSAWLGGVGPGAVTAVIAAIAVAPSLPQEGLVAGAFGGGFAVAVFVVLAGLLSWCIDYCVRSRVAVVGLNRELERQVAHLRTLFEIAPVGIAVAHDPDCRTITCNPAAAALLGVTPDRNISLSGHAPGRVAYRMMRDGRELPAEELPLQRAAARRTGVEVEELDIEVSDGRSYNVYCCAAPLLDDGARVTGSIGAFVDVTDRRKAAAVLRENEERLRLALEAANLESWEWNLHTGVVQWSSGSETHLGASPGRFETVYDAFLTMAHPDDRPRIRRALGRALWEGEPYDLQYRRAAVDGGEETWVEVKGRVLRDEGGDPCRMIGVNADITRSKRHEQERERLLTSERAARSEADRAQRRFRRLADSRMMGIVFIEGDRIAEANDAFLALVGYERDDLAAGGLRWRDISPSDRIPRDRIAFRDLLERGECTPYETEFRRKDGRRVPILLGAALFQHTPIESVAFVLDIADRRRAEMERDSSLAQERAARLEAEAANRAKDDFLAVVSHELRSPLNAIRMWTAVLRSGRADGDAERILEAIDRSAVAQSRVIEDLLDVSRIVAGTVHLELKRVDLGSVVLGALESIQPVAEATHVHIAASLASGLVVRGDAGRLQQAVSNLLSNAVKFSPADSDVEVRLTGGMDAVLTVVDHGKGIDHAFLPHVFERFRQADASRTREESGLGLGLAIARYLVVAHGGDIAADSAGPGRGATFTVRIPLDVEAEPIPLARKAGVARPTVPAALLGIRVLVVDDDGAARESITALLRGAGAVAMAVGSAEDAVRELQRESHDVLLADLAMPREDGFALLHRVRALGAARGGDLPAAAVTAHGGAKEREIALARGFQAFLTKPVAPEELVAMVASLAAGPGAA
jgi:PAS domain S-box-containing protein